MFSIGSELTQMLERGVQALERMADALEEQAEVMREGQRVYGPLQIGTGWRDEEAATRR